MMQSVISVEPSPTMLPLKVALPEALIVEAETAVKEPATAVVPPMTMLSIEPPVRVAPELARVFRVAVEEAESVVNAPAAAVVPPPKPWRGYTNRWGRPSSSPTSAPPR